MNLSIPILTLFILSTAYSFGGNFPEDAWGSNLLKDVPKAVAYMKAKGYELSVEPPPEDNSETTVSEIEYLGKLSQSRRPPDIILIHKENLDPLKRFFEVLDISREDFPKLDVLIRRIAGESYFPILYFKDKFSRIRPYQIDSYLTTVVDGPPHPSYPSGHATQGYLVASILAELFLQGDPRIGRIMELGQGIGTRREIAGVHYPSDTAAGVALAKQLKPLFMDHPEIRKAFDAAKSEVFRIPPTQ
jgi:hypothetical protein